MKQKRAAYYMAQDLIEQDAPGLYELAAHMGYRRLENIADQEWFINRLADLIELNGNKVS